MSQLTRVLNTVLFIFTPLTEGFAAITLKADTLQAEEMFLSEPTFKNPKADTFAAADGESGAIVQNQATNGTRDITLFEAPEVEELTSWSQKKPMPVFNLKVQYDLDNGGTITSRIQEHKHCTFTGPGLPGLGGNGAPVVKFPIAFLTLKKKTASGQNI